MDAKIEVGRKAVKYYRRREVPGKEFAVVNIPEGFIVRKQPNGLWQIKGKTRGNLYYESAAKLRAKKRSKRRT
jgi:hypothetical protein